MRIFGIAFAALIALGTATFTASQASAASDADDGCISIGVDVDRNQQLVQGYSARACVTAPAKLDLQKLPETGMKLYQEMLGNSGYGVKTGLSGTMCVNLKQPATTPVNSPSCISQLLQIRPGLVAPSPAAPGQSVPGLTVPGQPA